MTFRHVWGDINTPEAHSAISAWVSNLSFGHPNNVWPNGSSFGVMDGDKPCAGIVYHDYRPDAGTIQYSGAAIDRRWLVGPSLHLMFAHMFDRLGCQMVITGNSEENTGLHSILSRLDHKCHKIDRAWGPDSALMLWTLTREQWAANPIMQRSKLSFEREAANV